MIEEVSFESLNEGDIVHVSFHSDMEAHLFLNEEVKCTALGWLHTKQDRAFYQEYTRVYLVKKAERKLPTELGAAVKHPDGWKFIRIGEDSWRGITPDGGVSMFSTFTNGEVDHAKAGWELI